MKIGNVDFAKENHLIEIRNKEAVIVAKFVISEDAIHKKELMTENYIELSFTHNQYLNFEHGKMPNAGKKNHFQIPLQLFFKKDVEKSSK